MRGIDFLKFYKTGVRDERVAVHNEDNFAAQFKRWIENRAGIARADPDAAARDAPI
jgi:hypothetical protein